ncbi:MAG: STAS domain-containing protein [Acidobacteriota bacterium]
MTTQAEVRVTDDVTVVSFLGPIVAGNGDSVLRDQLQELVESGCRKVLLDLREVPRLDSAGVGQLVASHRSAQEQGVAVKVLEGTSRVWRVLELSDILPLLDTYKTEDEALEAFQS